MQSSDDTRHPPVISSSPQVRAISIHGSSRPLGIHQVNQMLTQISEIREMRVAALRREIESGHYRVKAEQVAEKLMEDQLLELFYS